MCRELEYKLGPGAEQLEQQPPLGPFPDPSRTLLVQARSRRSRTTSPSASACPSLPTRARCAPQMRSPTDQGPCPPSQHCGASASVLLIPPGVSSGGRRKERHCLRRLITSSPALRAHAGAQRDRPRAHGLRHPRLRGEDVSLVQRDGIGGRATTAVAVSGVSSAAARVSRCRRTS